MSIVRSFIDHISPLVINGAISSKAVEILDELLTNIETKPEKANDWVNDAIVKLSSLPRSENIIAKLKDFHPVVHRLRTPTPYEPSTHLPMYHGENVGPHPKPKEDEGGPVLIPPFGPPMYEGESVGPHEYGNWDRAKDWGPYVALFAALSAAFIYSGGLSAVGSVGSAGLNYLKPALVASGQIAARAPGYIEYADEIAPTGEKLLQVIQATKEALGYAEVPKMILDSVEPQVLLDVFKTATSGLPSVTPLVTDPGYVQYAIDVAKTAYPTIQNWASTLGNVHIVKAPLSFASNALTNAASGDWLPSVGDVMPDVSLGALFGKGLKGGSFGGGKGKRKLVLTGGQMQSIRAYILTHHPNLHGGFRMPFKPKQGPQGPIGKPMYHNMSVGPHQPTSDELEHHGKREAKKAFEEAMNNKLIMPLERGWDSVVPNKLMWPLEPGWDSVVPPPFDPIKLPFGPEKGEPLQYGGRSKVKRVKGGPLELFLGEVIGNAPTQLPTPQQAVGETLKLFRNHIEDVLKNHPWTRTNVTEAVRISTNASGITLPADKVQVIADYVLKPSRKNETSAMKNLQYIHDNTPMPAPVPNQLPAAAEPKLPGDEKGLSAESGIHIPPLNAFDVNNGTVEVDAGPPDKPWVPLPLNSFEHYSNEAIKHHTVLGAPKGYAPSLMDHVTPKPTDGWSAVPGVNQQMQNIQKQGQVSSGSYFVDKVYDYFERRKHSPY